MGWTANTEPDLYRYEIWRGSTGGGPYGKIANVLAPTATYTDTTVNTNSTYYYVITAQDTSFNRSPNSAEVSATAAPRQVAVTFIVTVPSYTPKGDTMHIAGSFPAPYPQWDPAALPMTRNDLTHAQITLTMTEGTALEYKYTRGAWTSVEKGPGCEEISNRQLTVSYGSNGTQTVNDTVAKWADLDSCLAPKEPLPSTRP
ncbi:MAG TPA: carbohydrate-binding module family 20 domain-containing protein [Chloroflexia bacterium]|nr:carbohydrate-binding module family 20 domain-containing protein [Chloroflexia bacterium]